MSSVSDYILIDSMNNYHFCVILLRFQRCNYTNIEELQPPSSSPSTIKKSNNDSHTGPIEAQRILVQLRRRKTLGKPPSSQCGPVQVSRGHQRAYPFLSSIENTSLKVGMQCPVGNYYEQGI